MTHIPRNTEPPIESYLKANWFMYWQGKTYKILSRDLRLVHVETVSDSNKSASTFQVTELLVPEGEHTPCICLFIRETTDKDAADE